MKTLDNIWEYKLKKSFWSYFTILVGLTLTVLSIQLYSKQLNLKNTNSSKGRVFVGKKTNLIHTLSGKKSAFSAKEIAEIQEQEFVKLVQPFLSNQFAVKARVNGSFPLKLDLFFEGLPSKYLDKVPEDFNWKKGQKKIPIIISQEMLNMWNFGFSSSQGLPQLDQASLKAIQFDIKISQNLFKGQIVGFSEQIQTILVPFEFLKWANSEFAFPQKLFSRTMVQFDSKKLDLLESYMEKNKLEYNKKNLLGQKLEQATRITLAVSTSIGLLFGILAVALLANQNLINLLQNKDSIQKLTFLGYDPEVLAVSFLKPIRKRLAILFLISVTLATSMILLYGSMTVLGTIFSICILLLFMLLSYYNFKRSVRRTIKELYV